MGRLKLFQFAPLVDVVFGYAEEPKLLDLSRDHLVLILEGKAVLTCQFLKFLVKVVFVLSEVSETFFLLFLRLTQIQIALEPGFDEPLILELIGLLGADAFLASVVRRLLVDLLKRRLVFCGDFGLFAGKDLAGLCGKLRAKRRDGRLGFTEFGVVGIEIALCLFEALVLFVQFTQIITGLCKGRRQFRLCIEPILLTQPSLVEIFFLLLQLDDGFL